MEYRVYLLGRCSAHMAANPSESSPCSGQGKSVSGSLEVLASLLGTTQNGSSGPIIMPGSGISPDTIGHVLDILLPLGLSEIHLSAGNWMEGGMSFRREGMGMGVGGKGDWGSWKTNERIVGEVIALSNSRVLEVWALKTRLLME